MIKKVINAGGSFSLKLIVQLGAFSLLALKLNINDFGLISYAFTVAWLLTNLSDYGFRIKLVKDISQGKRISNLKRHDTIKIILFAILYIILSLYIYLGINNYRESITLHIYMISALFLSLANSRFALIQGEEKFNKELQVNLESTILYIILIIASIYLLPNNIFVIALAYLCYCLYNLIKASLYTKQAFISITSNYKCIKREFLESFPYAILVIINIILVTVDVFLLQHYKSYESVAYYQVFIKINTGLLISFNILYTVLLPKISREIHSGNSKVINNISICIISIGLITVGAYYITEKYILYYFFGTNYLILSQYTIYIIIIALSKYIFWFTPELYLVTSGQQGKRSIIFTVNTILAVICYYIIIPKYDWIGAVKINAAFTFIIGISLFSYIKRNTFTKKIYTLYITLSMIILIYLMKEIFYAS
ncbi:oligosaccharide flippase family protein [Photorhabdus tasmaniensis]|uniref:Polysaccharide biosynthesis protein n=1 Tax=Photorhabdus tasmaniensis TaxID=1004159 RepID=A0ABX0GH21_9GAMM|nr:oligosaccharide flippase family protein [Photorhabdus tasmaniensis]NHB87591.1 hypothetical protein [Photorhabdus tasmaniensis]